MLLGPPRVERDGATVAFDTRKAVALLAVLALADRPRPRDVLAELLWPEHDAEHARGALRRTLSALRSAVGADFVDATRDSVSLVRSAGAAGRRRRVPGRRRSRAGRATRPRVFRGDFLEGFGLRDAPAFEDWQRAEADGLRRELALVLARLVEESGDLAMARRWLELDPLHEPAHRALIRLYAEQGDRAAALAQYRECVRTLSRELGVPPLEETTRLYEAISEGTLEAPAAPPVVATAPLPRAPLVGRAREWEALLGAYDGIARRRPRRAARGRGGHRQDAAGRGAGRGAAGARRRGAGRPGLRGGGGARVRPAGRGAARAAARGRRLGGGGGRARARRGGAAAGRSERLPSPAARRSGRTGALPRRRVGDARGRGGRAGAGRARDRRRRSGPTRRRSGCSTYGARRLAGRRMLVLLTSRDAAAAGRRVGDRAGAPRRGRGRRAAGGGGRAGGSSPTGSTRRPRGCRSCSSSTSTRSAPTRTGRFPRARASCCWRAWSR